MLVLPNFARVEDESVTTYYHGTIVIINNNVPRLRKPK